jgi:Ca2+/Na+ antiporter
MFLLHFILALLIGFILAIIFSRGFRRRGPWASFILFAVVVFLAAWAGGIWVMPFGPLVANVALLPFLLVGLLVALLLAAVPPVEEQSDVKLVSDEEKRRASRQRRMVDAFFWVLIVALLVIILIRYFAGPPWPA